VETGTAVMGVEAGISPNKAPKSDKVKLSHPLLAQRLRQLHFAPWQQR